MPDPTDPSSVTAPLPWIETPLFESYALSKETGCQIFLKLENLQPSGSFKSRGIGYFIAKRLSELPHNETKPHVFISSGGNAGLAAVHAARKLGLRCTVVVPLSTIPMMVEKLEAAGAYEVVQRGATWQDADDFLRQEHIGKHTGPSIYTPPFDHADIWSGHSTLVYEVARQMPTGKLPTVMICSVGGGGLLNGVCEGIEALSAEMGAETTTVLAVETEGAESLNASVKAGKLVTLNGITSQATHLGAVRVTAKSLEYAQQAHVISHVLTDAEAAMGCWRLADDERMLVELSCGVSVSLCYGGRLEKALGRKLRPDDSVVIVLCGGNNITVDMLLRFREEFDIASKR